jgi:hypothetical protein
MIYPITPAYLDGQPEKIAELYRGLEDFILRDICERFRLSGTATNTAIEQIRILQRRGYSLERIEEYIRKMLKLTQTQLDAILDDAVERNQIYYTETLTSGSWRQASTSGLCWMSWTSSGGGQPPSWRTSRARWASLRKGQTAGLPSPR